MKRQYDFSKGKRGRNKTRHTTSSGSLSNEQIESSVGADQEYERARRAALDLMNRGYHMGGLHSIPREELYQQLK
jgi:hypothetical protein